LKKDDPWTANEVGRNPKHEIRNSKQSQMTEFQMFQARKFEVLEFLEFEFVSDFDIRISDLWTPNVEVLLHEKNLRIYL